MNKKLANALIYPLKEGVSVFGGWVLTSIEVDHDGYDQIIYTFSPPNIKIFIRPIGVRRQFIYKTKNFQISVNSQSEFDVKACRKLISLIEKNDVGTYTPIISAQQLINNIETNVTSKSVAFFVPGHIGNVYDLSFRAIRIIRETSVVFVEFGKMNDLVEIEEKFGINLDSKKVIEYDICNQREIEYINEFISKELNICIFGAGEGNPTIGDTGWMLVSEISRLNVPIRTLAGGGALSTALMRLGHGRPFSFWGVLHNDPNINSILWYLRDLNLWPRKLTIPMPICFATGELIIRLWGDILQVVAPFKGKMRMLMDLTRDTEGERTVLFSELDSFDPKSLNPKTKIVLVFELSGFGPYASSDS